MNLLPSFSLFDFIKGDLQNFYSEFPREFLVMSNKIKIERRVILDFEKFFNRAYDLNGMVDLYAGIYSLRQIAEQKYDRLYNDFDCVENPKLALQDALKFKFYMESRYKGKTAIIKSGLKGYNTYTFFDEIHLKHFRTIIYDFIKQIKDFMELSTLDMSVVAQPNRVSRIPFMKHIAGKSLCLPYDDILHNPELNRIEFLNSNLAGDLKRLDDEVDIHKINYTPIKNNSSNKRYDAELQYIFRIMSQLPDISNSGWNRAIWLLVAPRLAKTYKKEVAHNVILQYLTQTNNLSSRSYCIGQINNAFAKKSIPMRLDTFIKKFPEVRKYWLMK